MLIMKKDPERSITVKNLKGNSPFVVLLDGSHGSRGP
ncbi:MAG: hypothetical protein PWQ88_314 [Candidatus Methanomethylophilaceae archaeon]|nr:hypothetical protein [Candidatus Methanomethylophilaceae archaeon]MDI3542002.1 hypothetical protein [Candidatus Methanomethylophilaceae archaeon]